MMVVEEQAILSLTTVPLTKPAKLSEIMQKVLFCYVDTALSTPYLTSSKRIIKGVNFKV